MTCFNNCLSMSEIVSITPINVSVWLHVLFVLAAVHVCVSDVMGQQEPEEEEELFEDVGDWEEEASDAKKEEYEVQIENEDEEARRMLPTSLNSEPSSCVTMEVMQRNQTSAFAIS